MQDLVLANSKILNIVGFDGDDDPENAVNWPRGRKWSIVGVLAAMTFATALASSMLTPGVGQIMDDFNTDSKLLQSFVVSVYILGYASGPLIIAPLSELYGRSILYHITNILCVVFTIACAVSPSLGSLIGFRLLAGMAGSAVLNIGGGTIADLFIQEERGSAMAIWTVGPLLGPVIGPVAGGFLSEAKGWRSVFWVLSGLIFAITVSFFFTMRETYSPIILERRAARLRKETGNPYLKSKMDSGLNSTQMFKRAIIRPMKLLVLSPIVLSFSIFIAIVYGYLYLLFTTMPQVFGTQYGFSEGLIGLTYLGIGGGMLVGVCIFGLASDRILRSKSRNGEMKPEYRLPLMTPGAFLIPAGLFIYGWTAEKQVFWLLPILGTSLVGLGLNTTFMSIQTYLVDAYTLHAASALAANTVLRSTVGALLPLAGPSMYARFGLGWGNSILGFIAVALTPMPFLFIKYGEAIRKNPRFELSL